MNVESEILENRDEYKDEMIIYLLFIDGKTQKEAAEFMYQKEYSKINTSTIKNARKTLIQNNLIESDGSLRNAVFESNLDYIIDRISEAASKRDYTIDEKELEGIRMFLESEWFRSLFSLDNIEDIQGIGRNINGTLEVSSNYTAAEIVTVMFDDVNMLAELGEKKDYSKIAGYSSFEDYLENSEATQRDYSTALKEVKSEIDFSADILLRIIEKMFLGNNTAEKIPFLPIIVEHKTSDIALAKQIIRSHNQQN